MTQAQALQARSNSPQPLVHLGGDRGKLIIADDREHPLRVDRGDLSLTLPFEARGCLRRRSVSLRSHLQVGAFARIPVVRPSASPRSGMLVPALRLDERRDALPFPVPIRLTAVTHGEVVDVDQAVIVTDFNDRAEHGHRAIPVTEVEHRDSDARVAPHVTQAQPLEIHVDENAPVIPVVPGCGRVWRPIGTDGGDDRCARLLQELDQVVRERCWRHAESLGAWRSVKGRSIFQLGRPPLLEQLRTHHIRRAWAFASRCAGRSSERRSTRSSARSL
jgi:hypothetical protein